MLVLLQLIVGLGLLNVWIIRAPKATGYRGGAARNLAEEFATYGLPPWAFYLVGLLKIGAATALLAGFWFPALIVPATVLVSVLMIGALAMHAKVGDTHRKFVPAFSVLAMSMTLAGLSL